MNSVSNSAYSTLPLLADGDNYNDVDTEVDLSFADVDGQNTSGEPVRDGPAAPKATSRVLASISSVVIGAAKKKYKNSSFKGRPALDSDNDDEEEEEVVYPYSTLDNILVPGHRTSAGGWCNSRRILYAALAIGAVLAITGALLAGSGNSSGANGSSNRLKVFIMAGGSNMAGFGAIDDTVQVDGVDVFKNGTFRKMLDNPNVAIDDYWFDATSNTFGARADVWIWSDLSMQDRSITNTSYGDLTVGYGERTRRDHIGPELGFGDVMGDSFEEQVLIIKTAFPGKTMQNDFHSATASGPAGSSYNEIIHDVQSVLTNLPQLFPPYRDMDGYDLTGLVWYQGWQDGNSLFGNGSYYEGMLVSMLENLRSDLNAPDLPVQILLPSVGGYSFNLTGSGQHQVIYKGQINVANTTIHPSMKWVSTVDIRPCWHPLSESPEPTNPDRLGANAATFWKIGTYAGDAMIGVLYPDH